MLSVFNLKITLCYHGVKALLEGYFFSIRSYLKWIMRFYQSVVKTETTFMTGGGLKDKNDVILKNYLKEGLPKPIRKRDDYMSH